MRRGDMELGARFAVRVVYPAHGPVCPRVEVRKPMDLVDFRDGGVCIMQETVVGFDKRPGLADRKVVTRTYLRKVRMTDVLATWDDWQAGEKVKTRSGGLALAPPAAEPFELVAA